jgi:protein LTV1
VPTSTDTSSVPSTSATKLDPEKRRKEQHSFGIFFDDDYDYLQHLREPGKQSVHWEEIPQKAKTEKEKPKIQLPSSVFASEFEEEEGLLHKAIPKPGNS